MNDYNIYDVGGNFEPSDEIARFLQEEEESLNSKYRKITFDDFVAKITARKAEIIFRKSKKIHDRFVAQLDCELDDNEIKSIQVIATSQANSYLARKARIAFEILKQFEMIENFQIVDAINAIKNQIKL